MLLFVMSSTGVALAQDPLEFFETQVRPLLAEKCFACHTQTKMGGLEMTSRDALLKGGRSGPAVEPKAPERSLLIRAVSYEDEKLKMPPSEQLTKEQVAVLTKWVDAGAAWPASAEGAAASNEDGFQITDEHRAYWAYRPVKGAVPASATAIDRFINDKLREKGLTPTPQADKRTLLRRVYFDLTGLPPTPKEMDAFLADDSPQAYAQVVDRLLASPRYGERWGRRWLDVARYSDDRLNSTQDEPYPNAFRYRDWVIKAFNDDMPYDLFVKAQIAADQLTEQDRKGRSTDELIGGLGLFGLSPNFQDDRVDMVTRGFMAITVACAQCHDHKFDPIPTEDYYSLLGIFNSTKIDEHPLVGHDVVEEYQAKKKLVDDAKAKLDEFLATQSRQLVDAFAAQTEAYVVAAWRMSGPEKAAAEAATKESGLDQETLGNWTAYLNGTPKEHKLLDEWHKLLADKAPEADVRRFGREIEAKLIEVIAEKKRIELENEILLGGDKSGGNLRRTKQLALPREEFYLWNDLASPNGREIPTEARTGILYYKGEALERFLSGVWLEHVRESKRRVAELEKNVPEEYPFEHMISDIEKPRNEHVHIRGNADNLGPEVPRHFLSILCEGEPEAFTEGSGRLELARSIASPKNPLTARVMVNRIWLEHFGRGIVGTPSNFGVMGERPTHPELLDYLAMRFVESGWSVKTLHREILLTDAYQRSSKQIAANEEVDGENKLLWRANRRRLDVEGLRDSLLYVAGRLVETPGGPPHGWASEQDYGRTVYRFVSRRSLDPRLGLFDFPNPNQTSERRVDTNTPLQGLFFYNSDLVMEMAGALAERIASEAGDDREARIERAYRLLFGRAPSSEETSLALGFLEKSNDAWPRLTHVWLSSNEFRYVD